MTIILEEQVELGDRLVLVAMSVIQARFDAAEEVPMPAPSKSCFSVRSPDASLSLMCGDLIWPRSHIRPSCRGRQAKPGWRRHNRARNSVSCGKSIERESQRS